MTIISFGKIYSIPYGNFDKKTGLYEGVEKTQQLIQEIKANNKGKTTKAAWNPYAGQDSKPYALLYVNEGYKELQKIQKFNYNYATCLNDHFDSSIKITNKTTAQDIIRMEKQGKK